jgi:hypothetical protein
VFCAFCVFCVVVSSACGGGGLFRQYEYEEDVYLSLDGTATVYVNSSLAALNALRGTSFDLSPAARVDRDAIRAYYSSPVTHVTWVRQSRRSGRRFVHIRLDVDNVNQLATTPPFNWSTYTFERDGGEYSYKQVVGASAGKAVAVPGWTGRELVAFRLHLPSKITYHPKEIDIRRGNILVWEQPLSDRLRGAPLTIDARMETQSILYRTLWLFGATFIAVALTFVVVIWWVLRKGAETPEPTS